MILSWLRVPLIVARFSSISGSLAERAFPLWNGIPTAYGSVLVLVVVNEVREGFTFTAVTRVQIPSGTPILLRNLRAGYSLLYRHKKGTTGLMSPSPLRSVTNDFA